MFRYEFCRAGGRAGSAIVLLALGLFFLSSAVAHAGTYQFCAPAANGTGNYIWACSCPDGSTDGGSPLLYCDGNSPNTNCHMRTCMYPPNGSQTDIGYYPCCQTSITCSESSTHYEINAETCSGDPLWACDLGKECHKGDDICNTGVCAGNVMSMNHETGLPAKPGLECRVDGDSACEDEGDAECPVGGDPWVGDPVLLGARSTRHTVSDIELNGAAGALSLERHYVSTDRNWATVKSLGAPDEPYLPRPFGSSPDHRESLRWWHSFYSFVWVAYESSGEVWRVRDVSGTLLEFRGCSRAASSCLAQPGPRSRESHSRLVWQSTGPGSGHFVLHRPGVGRFIYADRWSPEGAPSVPARYFLTRIEDTQHPAPGAPPRTRAALSYAAPEGLSCPGVGSDPHPGVPYLFEAVNAEGTRLRFLYKKVPGGRGGLAEECVLAHVSLVGAGGVLTPLVEYTYTQNGAGVEVAGRIAVSRWPQRGGATESYVYDALNANGQRTWQVRRNGTLNTVHTYDSSGYVLHDDESLTGWMATNVSIGRPVKGSCDGGTAQCEEASRISVTEYGYAGDGYRSYYGQNANYELERTSFASAPRVKKVGKGCSGASCSRVQEYVWDVLPDGTAVQRARSEWGGGWTAWDWAAPQAGSAAPLPELRKVTRGAVAPTGEAALETVRYAYTPNPTPTGGLLGERLRTEEQRASVLQAGADTAVRTLFDESTNRVKAVIRSGYTQGLSQGSWEASPMLRHQGTFYFTRHACLGSTTEDPLGRVLEIHGPCWVDGPEATDCSAALNARVPVTQYHYWPDGAGAPNALRLQKVVRYTGMTQGASCAGQPALETQYADYDAWGNPRRVTDPNGIETLYTYQEDRVTSVTTQGATWTYEYAAGKVTAVRFPRGDYERFCYSSNASNGYCAPPDQSWMGVLTMRVKQAFLNSTTWRENIHYSYGADKRLHAERRNYSPDGWGVNDRQARFFESDHQGNSTYEFAGGRYGNPNGYASARLFDGASRMVGTGLAYNSPPSLCGGLGTDGRPVSPLCAALSYDRADRLVGVDAYPELGTRANGARTCMSYDAHGNVTSVRAGCPASGTGGDCSACGQPASVYRYDDFGQVISADLPWTGGSGRTRHSRDAYGNLLAKQTPQMALDGEHLAFTYDALGRLLSAVRVKEGTSSTLYTLGYDASAAPDASCPQPANTRGRMLVRNDSFGQTWFSYDAWGHVTKEIRVRRSVDGAFTCLADTPASTLHTTYAYSPSGDLLSIDYPYGHRVTYSYANHPNSTVPSDRVSAVTLARWNGSEWGTLSSVSNIYWEPYGDVWGYQINAPQAGRSLHVEYLLGHDSGSAPTNPCTAAAPPHSDLTGRLRGLWVSGGAFSWAGGTADIFRRTYTWRGDQVSQVDTCLLGATTPRTETYTYDGMGRLSAASRPAGNFAEAGGAFQSRGYTYDGRGNRLTQVEDGPGLTLTHGTGALVDRLERLGVGTPGSMLDSRYAYDADGRATEKSGAEAGGVPMHRLRFNMGPSVGGASETVFRSVDVNGVTYEYFYDALGRRRLKRYPTTAQDEYFHDTTNRLLVDRGNPSVVPPVGGYTHGVDDTYVWLGNRPIMVVRGRLTAAGARDAQAASDCTRNGEAAACGVYFPVTDVLGKVVLMLDGAGRVAGAADHEPFGHVNRVAVRAETAHPYADDATVTLASVVQPKGSESAKVRVRLRFQGVDTGEGDYAWWTEAGTSQELGRVTGSRLGQVVTPWVEPPEAGLTVRFTAGPANLQSEPCPGPDESVSVSPLKPREPPQAQTVPDAGGSCECVTYPCNCCQLPEPNSAAGVALESYEYQRYQVGAQPYWTPLRFPGQYHDTETDLFENWNRYYDPSIGRYLQPEPVLQTPDKVLHFASGGQSLPAYAYALNNPSHYVDRDGNVPIVIPVLICAGGGCEAAAAALAAAGAAGLGAYCGITGKCMPDFLDEPVMNPPTPPNACEMAKGGRDKGENFMTLAAKAWAQATKGNPCDFLRAELAAALASGNRSKADACEEGLKFMNCKHSAERKKR